jgi:hypothetical protein
MAPGPNYDRHALWTHGGRFRTFGDHLCMERRLSLPLRRVAATAALLALPACADSASGPADVLAVNAAGVMYSVYPARTLLSSAALVAGELRTQRYYDDGNNVGLEPLWPLPDVSAFQWDGNRVGLLTTGGGLYARDRVSEWVAIASGVIAFQLEGDRIGALQTDSTLRVKEGIHGPWTSVASGVSAFQLEGNRVAALHQDGTLRVKEGIHGTWTEVATKVLRFELEGNRIAALQRASGHDDDDDDDDDADDVAYGDDDDDDDDDDDEKRPARGTLLVKDGIDGVWSAVATRVSDFQLEGNRIGVLRDRSRDRDDDDDVQYHDDDDDDDDDDGDGRRGLTLEVKDGINGAWTAVADHVAAFQLEGNRLGVLHTNGDVRAKDGINAPWTVIASGATAFQLQEDVIGVLSADALRLREGINGGWSSPRTAFAGATQLRLLVDVPLVFRTTPASYQLQADKCDEEFAQGEDADGFYRCYPEYRFGIIVGKYGRFCGAGVPSDGNWDWAHGQGVIDPVDGLCREHDHASWYGIDPNQFRYHACVVRYGYEHDRLTVNGVQVFDGSDEWDAAWALMPRTRDARTAWWQESSGPEACTLNLLADFTAATASKR